jgi:hypothetical protein
MKYKWAVGLGLALLSTLAWADNAMSLGSVGDIATTLSTVVMGISKLLFYAIIVCGIAFILGAIIQYKNHRANPQQVRLSTPVIFLIVGIVLVGFPLLLIWLGMGQWFGF